MTSYFAAIGKNVDLACIVPDERGVMLRLQYTNTAGKTRAIASQEFKTEYNAMLSLKGRYPDVIWSPAK